MTFGVRDHHSRSPGAGRRAFTFDMMEHDFLLHGDPNISSSDDETTSSDGDESFDSGGDGTAGNGRDFHNYGDEQEFREDFSNVTPAAAETLKDWKRKVRASSAHTRESSAVIVSPKNSIRRTSDRWAVQATETDKHGAELPQPVQHSKEITHRHEISNSDGDGVDDADDTNDEFAAPHVVAAIENSTNVALARHIKSRVMQTIQLQQEKLLGPGGHRAPLTRTAIEKERLADQSKLDPGNVLSRGGCGIFAIQFIPTGHVHLGSSWDFDVSRTEELSLLRAGKHPNRGLQRTITRHIRRHTKALDNSDPSDEPHLMSVESGNQSLDALDIPYAGSPIASGDIPAAALPRRLSQQDVATHESMWDDSMVDDLVSFSILQQFPAANGNAVPFSSFEQLLQRRLRAHKTRIQRQRLSRMFRSRLRRQLLPRWTWWVKRTQELRAIERKQAAVFMQRFFRGCMARAVASRLRQRNRIIRAGKVIVRAARGFLSRKVIRMRRFGKILHLATCHMGRMVRGLLARRYVEGIRRNIQSATIMQACWRGFVGRRLVHHDMRRQAAAIRLQLFHRKMHAKAAARRRQRASAAVVLQSAFRQRVARKERQKMRKLQAVLRLQCRFRIRAARRELENRIILKAAIRMQGAARVRQARIRAQLELRKDSATRIAAFVRSAIAVRGYKFIRQFRHGRAAIIQKVRRDFVYRRWLCRHNAASKIQSLYRVRATMRRIAEMKRRGMVQCVPIQAWWRGELARMRVRRLKRLKAAGVLQRTMRMLRARLLAARIRKRNAEIAALRNHSARAVQRVYRGLKGRLYAMRRRRLAELALLRAKREAAALRVQTSWRSHRGRLALHLLRRARDDNKRLEYESARRVQNNYRSLRARRALRRRREKDASLRIQTWWRAQHGRLAYMMIQRGARAGQRQFRKSLAQKSFRKLRRERAALLIQTRYRCHRGQLSAFMLRRARREHEKAMQRSALKVQRRVRIRQAKQERARRAAALAHRHQMARRIQARYRAHRGQISYFLLSAALKENLKEATRVAIWAQKHFRRHRALKFLQTQRKQAAVLHDRDRQRLAAIRVQCRWRAHRGRLAYHLKLQAQNMQAEDAAAASAEYDPANWIRGWDEDAKLHYYINILTGKSQWDRPQGFVGYSADGVWAECEDQESGYMYYYNYINATTQWEKPEGFDTVVDGDWQKYWDGEHQAFYYYNSKTEETTWEQPVGYGHEHTAVGNVVNEAMEVAHDSSNGRWLRYWDDDSQAYYFYHTETGQATNEEPAEWTDAVDESHGSTDNEVAKEEFGSTASTTGQSANGSSTWSKEWDEASQSYYYYNSATDEVSYDVPVGFVDKAPATDEWTEHWDEDSGMAYYYNATTDETTWEDPRPKAAAVDPALEKWQSLASSSSAGGSGGGGYDSGSAIKHDDGGRTSKMIDAAAQFYATTDHEISAQTYDDYSQAYSESATQHWVQMWDEQHQAYYYQDQYTHEVIWEEPDTYTPYAAPAAAAPEIKYCANCSKKLRAAANFCRFCGSACAQ